MGCGASANSHAELSQQSQQAYQQSHQQPQQQRPVSVAHQIVCPAFLKRLAPNGQPWFAYCGAVPPAADAEGRLVGAWGECLNSAVVFEKCHPDWESTPGFEDGPAGQVVEFCNGCGFEQFAELISNAEDQMHEEMDAAQEDPLAFLQHRARNGMTWKDYCGIMEPTQDHSGFVNGAWGDCITAAVIFEKQNPEWSQLPAYMDDGPAGQVLNYFNDCGHEPHVAALSRTEEATHQAVDGGRSLPVYDDVYQAIIGTHPAEEIGQDPPMMTGRKKALLVGCNYPGTKAQLNGCINDTQTWGGVLQEHYGFQACDIVSLTDDRSDPRQRPTLCNIRSGLQWLTAGSQPGDVLFFQFSGHGTQIESKYSDEADGKDEALCPTDYKESGFLVDNEIYDLAVNSLQSGVKLTIILDCCHSGTAVDLPFIWTGSFWEEESGVGFSAGDVQMFSGCEDSQCSMDVTRHGRAAGAMTSAMSQAIAENPTPLYPELLQRLHEILGERGMTQIPRLTSSQQFDPMGKNFSLCEGAIPNMNPTIGIGGHHRRQPARGGGYDSLMHDILE